MTCNFSVQEEIQNCSDYNYRTQNGYILQSRFDNGVDFALGVAPHTGRDPISEIASTLEIPESEITMTGLPVEIVFNGVCQLVIPVRSSKTLAAMRPDLIKLKLLNLKLGVQTTDIFTTDALNDDCICYSRHFSPAMGMWEDLGSGAGGSSIAAYMLRHGVITSQAAVMEQGPETDKLSRVHIDVRETNGQAIAVQVGGLAVTSMTRSATIHDNDEIVVV